MTSKPYNRNPLGNKWMAFAKKMLLFATFGTTALSNLILDSSFDSCVQTLQGFDTKCKYLRKILYSKFKKIV